MRQSVRLIFIVTDVEGYRGAAYRRGRRIPLRFEEYRKEIRAQPHTSLGKLEYAIRNRAD